MQPQSILQRLSPLFTFLPNISTSPISQTTQATLLQTIYQFPHPTWIENLSVRSNGHILATLTNVPEIWEIVPSTHTASLLYTFPYATSAFGITEVSPDIFAIAVGNFSLSTFTTTPGSYSMWSIDFTCDEKVDVKVKKVTDIPEAQLLNGMTTLPTMEDTVLVGDSNKGVIWRVDVKKGVYSVAIDVPEFQANSSVPLELGVNGIRWREGFVYFVNTFNSPLYSRVPVNADGKATGPVEVISSGFTTPDDFALDRHGNAWITTDPSNSLVKVTLDGEVTVIAGGIDKTTLLGPTSAAFGRTRGKLDTLYLTTNGGLGNPPSSGIEPGKLYSLDTSKL